MDGKLDKNQVRPAGAQTWPAAQRSDPAGKAMDTTEGSYGSEATTTLMIQAGQMPGEQVPVRDAARPERNTLGSMWAGLKGRWAARFGGKNVGS